MGMVAAVELNGQESLEKKKKQVFLKNIPLGSCWYDRWYVVHEAFMWEGMERRTRKKPK